LMFYFASFSTLLLLNSLAKILAPLAFC